METQVMTANEYRNLPLSELQESKTNPRRIFEDAALRELAESIRVHGVLSPLLVRPLTGSGFEIVAGARRYRAAHLAEAVSVPVRIVHLSDAEALAAQQIENLQRKDLHPMEEAQGFRALLNLEEPHYSVEQIAAKIGKSPAYVTTRLKLTDLTSAVVEAFYAEEIGVGHALLLAKLQPAQQAEAMKACYREVYNQGSKQQRILLPVRNLQFWIEANIVLALKDAPFDRKDAALVPAAGSCTECPKRTGHNKLLFSDISGKQDACTDPACYQAKVAAHVAKTLAARPSLVQISTAYGQQREGSATLPRNKYTEIRAARPQSKDEAKRPEFKVCRFTADAIVTDGSEIGALRKVCANSSCPIHHPARTTSRRDDAAKAEAGKQRREQAIAQTTGLRVLAAISEAVPVRLMKRDLLFLTDKLVSLLDESRIGALARQHGIRQKRDDGGVTKAFLAYLRPADEGTLSKAIVEAVILLVAARPNGNGVLREAATLYNVDTEAVAAKVKQEFAAREKAKKAPQPVSRSGKNVA